MTQETTFANSIFIEIDKTIKAIGMERLVDILKFSRKNKSIATTEQIISARKIIDIVCQEFDITEKELHSGVRINNRRYVVGICAFFIYKELDMDMADISFILKKDPSQIIAYRNEVNLLNEKNRFDIKILEKIKKIKNQLITLKNE